MHGLQLVAFLALAFVFIARTPSAIVEPRSRWTWFASIAGSLALFTRGVIIPQAALDDLLGGTNVLHLVQNLLSTTAFWCITQAAIRLDGKSRKLIWWPLVVSLAAFTVPFFLIDRGPSSYYFIPEHADQTALWAYAGIYMATILLISVSLLMGIRGRPARPYWFFRIGAVVVIIACTDEILFLTMARWDAATPRLRDTFYHLFDPFFYVGVILLAVGIASFTVIRFTRDLNLRHKLFWLRRVLNRRGVQPPARENSDDLLGAVYDAVIAIRDREAMQQFTLHRAETRLVARSEKIITRHLASTALTNKPTIDSLTAHGAPS